MFKPILKNACHHNNITANILSVLSKQWCDVCLSTLVPSALTVSDLAGLHRFAWRFSCVGITGHALRSCINA